MIPPTKPDVSCGHPFRILLEPFPDDEARVADFRTRVSRAHQERHELNLLTRARKTLIDLDAQRASSTAHSGSTRPSTTCYRAILPTPTHRRSMNVWRRTPLSKAQSTSSNTPSRPKIHSKRRRKSSATSIRNPSFDSSGLPQNQSHYCLFCGCSYNDQHDLEQNCPGN